MIRRGVVLVDGAAAAKPGQLVAETVALSIADNSGAYVSRGALKLAAALDHFALDPTGRVALDLGASTGGFTQLLLERGARRCYAVDVGRGQLAAQLANDDRVVAFQETDARNVTAGLVPEPVGVIVADLSFIGVGKALGPSLCLAAPDAWLVVLVKPQFEVGPDAVGKGGIVRDPAERAAALDGVAAWLASQDGWDVMGSVPSPVLGAGGNEEFLLAGRRAG